MALTITDTGNDSANDHHGGPESRSLNDSPDHHDDRSPENRAGTSQFVSHEPSYDTAKETADVV